MEARDLAEAAAHSDDLGRSDATNDFEVRDRPAPAQFYPWQPNARKGFR